MIPVAFHDARVAAGRAYLALEPLYAAAKDRTLYDYYVRVIGESPQVFQIKDKALVSPADRQRRVESIKQKFLPDMPDIVRQHIQYAENYAAGATLDPAARAAFLQQNIAVINPTQAAVLFQFMCASPLLQRSMPGERSRASSSHGGRVRGRSPGSG